MGYAYVKTIERYNEDFCILLHMYFTEKEKRKKKRKVWRGNQKRKERSGGAIRDRGIKLEEEEV